MFCLHCEQGGLAGLIGFKLFLHPLEEDGLISACYLLLLLLYLLLLLFQPIKKTNHAIRPSVVLLCTSIVIKLPNFSVGSAQFCPVYVDFLHRFYIFFVIFNLIQFFFSLKNATERMR